MTSNTRNQGSVVGLRAAVPTAAKRSPVPRAFTLVELLVVVVIISMLMALLLPAVMRARANAKKTECANNQKQLSTAILTYETVKKRLPGYVNQVRGTTVGWVPVLLPFISRNDLWKGATGWRMGFSGAPSDLPPTPYIKQLVCPSDVTSTDTPQLSYVVNCGLYNDPTAPLVMVAPGVFRDYSGGSSGAISLSDIESPSQTVMLSEKLPARLWSSPSLLPTYAGFLWPDTTRPAVHGTFIGKDLESMSGGDKLYAPLPAIHPGVVIVTFCDGHVAEIAEDAPCRLYIGIP